MKNIHLFLLLCILCPHVLQASYFKHLGTKDGLSQLSVLAIHQDQLGRMWFGTREGVSVYDGKQMNVYKTGFENKLQNGDKIFLGNEVNMIREDRIGNVFLKAEGALTRYDIRKETFHQIRSSRVRAITSYNGEVWCAVSDSLFVYDAAADSLRFQFKTGLSYISFLIVSSNKIWVATQRGLYVVQQNKVNCVIPHIETFRLFESSQKELWIGTRMNGLYRLPEGGQLIKVPITPDGEPGTCVMSNQIREFVEDKWGNIWFGTFKGLQKYDPRTQQYTIYEHEPRQGALAHSSIFALYKDRQGTIWIGSYYGGVNYFNPGSDIFSYYTYDTDRNDCLHFPVVGSMIEDKDSNIWIGTDGGGLNCLHRKQQTFSYYTAGGNNALLHNNVKSICYDKKRDQIYIGTYTGGVSRYDRKTGQFYNYLNDFNRKGEGPSGIIFQVMFKNDRLYVSALNGFFRLHPETEQFEQIYKQAYLSFEIDEAENAWFTTGRSLKFANLRSAKKGVSISLNNANHYTITQIFKSSDGRIYIGTLGGGFFVYDAKTGRQMNYTVEKHNLLSNYCYRLIETHSKNILITSDKGITLFSPTTQTMRSIHLGMGGVISSIGEGCGSLVADNGDFFIGGVDGLISFREEDLDVEENDSKLYFSDLYIHNTKIHPTDESRVLKEALPFTRTLELKANQNNLILNFSNSNYIDILKNTWYEYKLDGFDKKWIPTTRTSLYYTNLLPGDYTLRVREMGNSLNTKKRQEITLHIVICSPWYNTFWAWTLYCLFISLAVYWIWHVKMARKLLSLSLEQEKREKERMKELSQAKLHFFTNVSHEFRTPLTLIISHIEMLLQNNLIPTTLYNQILKIETHTRQMRNLISELLDFRRFEQNHVTLKISEQDMVPFLKEIYLSFSEYALQRNIQYHFDCEPASALCYFDTWQMTKVGCNLLSNAFKYSPDGSRITLRVKETEEQIQFEVIDTGIGIAAKEIDCIFEQFYQIEQNKSNSSSGIGLALTKSIVLLHHGQLNVESRLGEGSRFTVTLQKGKAAFEQDKVAHLVTIVNKEDAILEESLPDQTFMTSLQAEQAEECGENIEAKRYTVLLVEDNKDLIQLLVDLFSPLYNTLLAYNGEEALAIATTEKPDLIVSDVMMPVMNGNDLCLQIKNSIHLCHTPVVLLTALNTVDQNIAGLRRGADDYIVKPFNAKILLTRCNNLIRNRMLLQSQFARTPHVNVDLLATNPIDKKFLEQVSIILDKHIDNTELGIPILCKELGVGHTLLHGKFKGLTGMAPCEFILNYRLKKAALILREERYLQISEIADKLGFSSPRYFSRCFKNQFSVTPVEYRKEESAKQEESSKSDGKDTPGTC